MRLRYTLLLFLLVLAEKDVFSQIITLQEAIHHTLNRNLQIKKGENDLSLAALNYKQSRLGRLPTLSSSISQNAGFGLSQNQVTFELLNTQNYNTSLGLGTSVNVFSGGIVYQQIKQNKLLISVGETNIERLKNDLKLQVITTYFEALLNKELWIAAKSQYKLDQYNLERDSILFSEGQKIKADVSQSASQLSITEMNINVYENNFKLSLLNLSQLMEFPVDTVFDVQTPENHQYETLDINAKYRVLKSLKAQFPSVKAANLLVQSSEQSVKIAKGSFFPRISLNAGLNSFASFVSGFPSTPIFSQVKRNFGQFVGVSMSIPVFTAFQNRINVDKAKANLWASKIEAQIQQNNYDKIVNQAIADYKAAMVRYQSSQKVLVAQEDNLFAVSERYKLGVVNALEYNTALTNRNKAENDCIQAKYNLIFKATIIDYYINE